MKSGQKGFTVVEALLVLILISILGFTGYYVYHSRNNANSTYSNATNVSATSKTTKTNQDPAVTFTQSFYNQYIGASSKDARDQLVNKYGTENSITAYEQATAADPILCAQNTPKSISVTGTGGSPSAPHEKVHEVFSDSTQDLNISLLIYQNSYRLDTVTCPSN